MHASMRLVTAATGTAGRRQPTRVELKELDMVARFRKPSFLPHRLLCRQDEYAEAQQRLKAAQGQQQHGGHGQGYGVNANAGKPVQGL
jgi:hypothetical protein